MQSTEDIVAAVIKELRPPPAIEGSSSSYMECLREHAYKNAVYGLLGSPARFVALVQVELLDLQNTTSGGAGSGPLSVFAVVRCKREASNAPCTNKNRTKVSPPNPPLPPCPPSPPPNLTLANSLRTPS
jgi:hypothetical protein